MEQHKKLFSFCILFALIFDSFLLFSGPVSIHNATKNLANAPRFYTTWNTKDIKLSSDRSFNKNYTYILPLKKEADNKFVFPCNGKIISPFGYRGRRIHAGTDIKLNLNDDVYAAFDGVVRMAKRYSGYGNFVVIRHKNGLETCYGHLNKIKVKVNQEVKAGDIIGLGGRTGRASTTHLHFETRFLGDAFNSAKLVDYTSNTLKLDTLVIDKNTFIKAKKFIYKKNKRGKRVKVFINDDSENEQQLPVNSENVIYYQEEWPPVETFSDTTTTTYKEETDAPVVTEKEKITAKTKISKSKKGGFYKVRSGDTLSKISRNNGISVKDLCKINNLEKDAILSLGKKIRIK
ncbi:MAG: peptidoglycan DD-metalloendopeptidase family protein [Bacteroidetes bacterium]|nr:peptidoglycan DD-metalloendopeptidase family protein [Bacteroidota bacterium]